jgi:Xaa-Pro aminopeptidase
MAKLPHQQRLQKFQQHLKKGQAVLISKSTDIFYLAGFPQLAPTEREAFLLIKPRQAILFHQGFSPTLPSSAYLTNIPKTNLKKVATYLEDMIELLLDEQTLTIAEFKQLKKQTNCSLTDLNQDWIWQQRELKDPQEISLMRRAGQIASQVFGEIIPELKVGQTELAVAQRIAQLVLKKKAVGQAFPTIVAFGKNGALPHYQPRAVKLKAETPVLIDFGVNAGGYYSDMTRTIWFGRKPSQKFLEIERVVLTAYAQTLTKLKTRKKELTAKDLDGAARGVIAKQGFADQFIHTTGHGLGLEIHEPPSLFWQNEKPIKPNMTITIEPGIYLPGEFGYRHENTVLVTKKGAKILTTSKP